MPHQIDRRRRQWVPLSVHAGHGRTADQLLERFGRDGLLVWILYLAACKANPIQGQLSFTSEADGWTKLGLYGVEPEFTLADFFSFTGQLKKTRQTRVGRITHVLNTRWEDWNDVVDRDIRAARSARKRAENTGTKEALSGHREDHDHERDQDHDQEQQQDQPELEDQPQDLARTRTQPRGGARETDIPETHEPGEPAAAAQAPPTDADILAACRRFGADRDIVFPIAEQTTAAALADIVAKVEKKIHSRRVDDVPALFVHLLQRAQKLQTPAEPQPIAVPTIAPEPIERLPTQQALELNVRRLTENGRDWPTIEQFVTDAFGTDHVDQARAVYDDAATEPGTTNDNLRPASYTGTAKP